MTLLPAGVKIIRAETIISIWHALQYVTNTHTHTKTFTFFYNFTLSHTTQQLTMFGCEFSVLDASQTAVILFGFDVWWVVQRWTNTLSHCPDL